MLQVDVRPTLYYGQKLGWWQATLIKRDSFWALTALGYRKLQQLFPSLVVSSTLGQSESWKMVIFQKAPSFDAGFQYLRQQLIADRSLPLATGVYLHPFGFSPTVETELADRYFQQVLVAKVSSDSIGEWDAVINQHYRLPQLVESSQVIGTYLNRMLTTDSSFETMTDHQKATFCSYFYRFYDLLRVDVGLLRTRFPQVKSSYQMLETFQQILRNS